MQYSAFQVDFGWKVIVNSVNGGEHSSTADYNRLRYELLIDRRRALYDLDRLSKAIAAHPGWQRAVLVRPWLLHSFEQPIEELTGGLCPHASQATAAALLSDIRRIYGGLIRLSKLWVSLEHDADPGAASTL